MKQVQEKMFVTGWRFGLPCFKEVTWGHFVFWWPRHSSPRADGGNPMHLMHHLSENLPKCNRLSSFTKWGFIREAPSRANKQVRFLNKP